VRLRGPLARPLGALAEFLRTEAAGGAVLLAATVAALVWANGPWQETYESFWTNELTLGIGDLAITETLRHWVNDGLMTFFFLVVGLEIKRELVLGELRDPRTAAVPVVAAVGGMVVPALIYLALNAGGAGVDGWGIPVATDIAFAVGVLVLLGDRIPSGLKLMLLTLAIVDDIGAILVIAVFYSEDLAPAWLLGAAAAIAAVLALRALRVNVTPAYVLPGALLWLSLFEAGIHPTLAGVVLGLLTPTGEFHGRPVIETLEHRLHPFASFVAVPLFALAGAGVVLSSEAFRAAADSPVSWGVALGLVLGKFTGVTAAVAITVRSGFGRAATGVTARHVLGLGLLAGIGFTVSLFVAELAFEGAPRLLQEAKLAILLASAVAGGLGALTLLAANRAAPTLAAEEPARP